MDTKLGKTPGHGMQVSDSSALQFSGAIIAGIYWVDMISYIPISNLPFFLQLLGNDDVIYEVILNIRASTECF